MDISDTLAAEINLAWLSFRLDEMKGDLHDLIEENDIEDDEYLDDIFVDIQDALVRVEQSLIGIIDELESIHTTADRLCECVEINAWELNPCWNVYQKLREQVTAISFEPLEHDSDDLEKQLINLRQDIRSIKSVMYEVDDYLDLPEEVKKRFLFLADNLNNEAAAESETTYKGALLVYSVYLRARDYCDCQKATNKESYLKELGELCQAVGDYTEYWR